MSNEEYFASRKEFVAEKLNPLLNAAKPHLRCELMLGKDAPLTAIDKDNNRSYIPNDELVVIRCDNGYFYVVNVTANSLIAIAEAVIKAMVNK